MFASPSLLAAASSPLLLLFAATAFADSSSPYSKFLSDANALLAAPTGTQAAQLDAIYSWQVTQTAVPSATLESQYQDYLNAYMTAASAPLPPWVTAIPSSLQSVMTSFLQAEATLVRQDIAPLVSQVDEEVSASTYPSSSFSSSENATVVTTSAPTMVTASSGFAQVSANGSAVRVSSGVMPSANSTGSPSTTSNGTAGGSPTNSVTPPKVTTPQGGADRPAGVAGLAAVVGVLGMIVLL